MMMSSLRVKREVVFGRASMVVTVATILTLLSIPASASEDYCLIPHTKTKDKNATATFQRLEHMANARYMSLLAGTWFHQIRSPGTNQNDNQYQTRLLQNSSRFRVGGYRLTACPFVLA